MLQNTTNFGLTCAGYQEWSGFDLFNRKIESAIQAKERAIQRRARGFALDLLILRMDLEDTKFCTPARLAVGECIHACAVQNVLRNTVGDSFSEGLLRNSSLAVRRWSGAIGGLEADPSTTPKTPQLDARQKDHRELFGPRAGPLMHRPGNRGTHHCAVGLSLRHYDEVTHFKFSCPCWGIVAPGVPRPAIAAADRRREQYPSGSLWRHSCAMPLHRQRIAAYPVESTGGAGCAGKAIRQTT
jgi:hypothetical protein